jgi:uncharacterized protein (TIGR02265 family)
MSHVAQSAAPQETYVQQSIFEGLFVKMLKPTGAFAEDLLRAGYDLKRQERIYPESVFKACVRIACRHVYPGMEEGAAMRLLGRRFIEGFFDTIAGRIVAVSLPVLGPVGLIRRLPRLWAMGTKGIKAEVREVTARQWLIEVHSRNAMGDFDAGFVSYLLERMGVDPKVEVTERREEYTVLSVSW